MFYNILQIFQFAFFNLGDDFAIFIILIRTLTLVTRLIQNTDTIAVYFESFFIDVSVSVEASA